MIASYAQCREIGDSDGQNRAKSSREGQDRGSCPACRYLIYSSVSPDRLADGLNAKALRDAGRRRNMRFRGVDAFDLMRWGVHGLPPSVQVGKWCATPDMNGHEVVILALRAHNYGQKAIAKRVGYSGVNQNGQMKVRNYLKRLGLPCLNKGAAIRANKHAAKSKQRRRYEARLKKIAYRAAYRTIELLCKSLLRPTGELFIGPVMPPYWRDVEVSRARNAARARANYRKNKHDPLFILPRAMRTRVHNAIRRGHSVKCARTLDLLGCSIDSLKIHLENQFSAGMGWHNYGLWHIDHIIPIAAFDLSNPMEQKMAFNYTNLQPLWAVENYKKSSRLSIGAPRCRVKRARGLPLPAAALVALKPLGRSAG